MTEPSRRYPARPILAASIAVFRDGRVLLAQRINPPAAGRYSLPGGLVEVGEALREAALRELREETGVEARIVGFNDHVEVIERDREGQVERHFVIASFVALWVAGEGRPSPETADVVWVDPADIERWPTTPHLAPIVRRASRLAAAA